MRCKMASLTNQIVCIFKRNSKRMFESRGNALYSPRLIRRSQLQGRCIADLAAAAVALNFRSIQLPVPRSIQV